MSALVKALRGRTARRSDPALSLEDYVNFFTYNGLQYPFTGGGTLSQDRELPPQDFAGYVQQLYRANGIVYACMAARMRLFSEARFQFQRMNGGEPGALFGSGLLEPLERPWGPSSTTGDLLSRMIQDADLAGNAFIGRLPSGRLTHLRPDWMTIVVGSKMAEADARASGSGRPVSPNWMPDAEVAGYVYEPGGRGGGMKPVLFLPENMAHFAPTPDPLARFRGMSWLTPVIREILGDSAAMQHKLMFFEQGATANMVVTLGTDVTPENFERFVELFEEQQEGVLNAYKTLFFGGGASVEVVGSDMKQLDFKVTQGAGETRIAAASGIPAIIVGLSEGLEASTYSNFAQARRACADGCLRPLWRNAAGSLETLVDKGGLRGGGTNARLWYDDRHIPFLQEDVKDDAEVQQIKASTMSTLISAGYEPDAVTTAVSTSDLGSLVGQHSGLISVQLIKPGEAPSATGGPPAAASPPNGKAKAPKAPAKPAA